MKMNDNVVHSEASQWLTHYLLYYYNVFCFRQVIFDFPKIYYVTISICNSFLITQNYNYINGEKVLQFRLQNLCFICKRIAQIYLPIFPSTSTSNPSYHMRLCMASPIKKPVVDKQATMNVASKRLTIDLVTPLRYRFVQFIITSTSTLHNSRCNDTVRLQSDNPICRSERNRIRAPHRLYNGIWRSPLPSSTSVMLIIL